MPATVVHRGLTVWVNPVERSARVRVHMPGREQVHVVTVEPRDGAWTVTDNREDEPTWFRTFEEAIGEALTCGAQSLEGWIVAEMLPASVLAMPAE
jgi:hypothetical protein